MNIKKLLYFLILGAFLGSCTNKEDAYKAKVEKTLESIILPIAKTNLQVAPLTVTSFECERSEGGSQDFYSEGDYWWPDSLNPNAPYIRKDGMTNPANFTKHREALMSFSEIVGNLTSAYLLTKDTVYAKAVIRHCEAWFINESTKMNPHFLYAQAIKGRHTGRGIGIIDGIHFMEVAQSLSVLDKAGLVDEQSQKLFKQWFNDFTMWLTTHPYGKDEMVHPNNHGTCWNMQVALYASYAENDSVFNFCKDNYKKTLLPSQMGGDGSFPLEIARTKPYGYSLFNLDAMAMNCLILSDASENLWEYATPDGKSIELGLAFMAPYVENKGIWPMAPDVMYWDNWPVAHPSFLFGSIIFDNETYYDLWEINEHKPEEFEVKRNLPVRNPLIWLERLSLARK